MAFVSGWTAQLFQLEANDLKEVKHDLKHLIPYAIKWFENLQEKYGKGRHTTHESAPPPGEIC